MFIAPNQIGGIVVPPPRVRTMVVRGLWNQYATEFLLAHRGGTDNVRFVQPDTAPNLLGGGSLVSSVTSQIPTHWHVNVQAREVLTPRINDEEVFVSNALPGSIAHSVLKARITWQMGLGCQDGPFDFYVDMDIGHGISTVVGPANGVTVEVLVPDPASIPDVLPPGYADVNFNTEVGAALLCVGCCDSNFVNRYTQSYYVEAGTDASEVFARLHPNVRQVQIFSTSETNANPQWVTMTQDGPRELGSIEMDGVQSDVVEVPQTATHIRLSSSEGVGTTFTVVEVLLR